MSEPIRDAILDTVLALQLTVAWAGEGLSEPPRLGWWQTDLVDELGGGDLLARLLPRTHRWASLEAVLRAATRTDARARAELARPEAVRTLFFWGFEIDEKLADRFAVHRRGHAEPRHALPWPADVDDGFDRQALAETLRPPPAEVEHRVVPGGRELPRRPGESLDEQARRLAAALVPWAEAYPMPFLRGED